MRRSRGALSASLAATLKAHDMCVAAAGASILPPEVPQSRFDRRTGSGYMLDVWPVQRVTLACLRRSVSRHRVVSGVYRQHKRSRILKGPSA